jgi:hypothetical protein
MHIFTHTAAQKQEQYQTQSKKIVFLNTEYTATYARHKKIFMFFCIVLKKYYTFVFVKA